MYNLGSHYFRVPVVVLTLTFLFVACDSQAPKLQTEAQPLPQTPHLQTETQPPLAEEALFRGIIFGQGEVARAIPEIRNHRLMTDLAQTEEQLKAMNAFNTELLGAIRATRPGYLNEFNAEMRSGNHQRIAKALQGTGSVIVEVLPQMESVKQMAARIESDPAYRDKLVQILTNAADGTALTEHDFKAALAGLASGNLNSDELRASPESALVVLGVVAAAFVSTVAVAINYAIGLNVIVNIAAATSRVVGFDPIIETTEEMSMYMEKLVNSIAATYAAK